MALSIKHPEADRLARDLARVTGESLTEAVVTALRQRLNREQARAHADDLREDLRDIRRRCQALPVLDARPPDEIMGYDENGLPQ